MLYKYDYTVALRTEFAGSGDNTSDLFLKADLDIFFPKPCEGYLRINNVKLYDTIQDIDKGNDESSSEKPKDVYDYYDQLSDETTDSTSDFENLHPKSNQMNIDLTKNLLRFAFHDGLIGEVCPTQQETPWVLNFKKGILSSFQNTMMRFDVDYNTTETDVSGDCEVQYSLESTTGVYVIVRKTKDITTCRRRYATQSVLQTTPYIFRDDKTIWPILNSQSYCNVSSVHYGLGITWSAHYVCSFQLTIDNNVYREISCQESHLLVPFSNGSSGALTTSQSKLKLQGEESYSVSEFLESSK